MCPEGRQTGSLFLNWEARRLPENRIDAGLLQRRPVVSLRRGWPEPGATAAAGAKVQLFAHERAAREA